MTEPLAYRFEPLDRSVFVGLTVTQCALLGGGMVASAVVHTVDAPLAVTAVPLLAAAILALVPTPRRPLAEMLAQAAGWALRRRRSGCWFARLPLLAAGNGSAVDLPPCLAGLSILTTPDSSGTTAGVVHDRSAGTMSALVPVGGVGLLLLPVPDQERLLADWGRVLAEAAAGHRVASLSWSVAAGPADLGAHRRWLESRGTPGRHLDGYGEVLADAGSAVQDHQVVVTVTVTADRSRPGRSRDGAHARAALDAAAAAVRGLESAGLEVTGPLTPDAIRRLLRARIDPEAPPAVAVTGRLAERLAGVGIGPLAVDRRRWGEVRLDGALHRSFWVEAWPDQPRPADWLATLLAPLDRSAGIPLTVTVHFLPEDPARSARRLARELTKHETDAETRGRADRRTTAFHRRAHQAVLDRGEELAAGYPALRYVGLVDVAAPTVEILDARCRTVEQHARAHGLGLRALHGRHDRGWAATLPLGLAPRAGVAS